MVHQKTDQHDLEVEVTLQLENCLEMQYTVTYTTCFQAWGSQLVWPGDAPSSTCEFLLAVVALLSLLRGTKNQATTLT